MSENENNNTEQESAAKGKKGFGNTIVLFIVFFIIFTVLVTGVAFFANKIRKSGTEVTQTEKPQSKDITNPENGKNFVMDEKGNVNHSGGDAKAEAQPAAEPAPAVDQKATQAAPAAKPEPIAKPVPAKPAQAKPVSVKPAPAKPAPTKKTMVKEAPAKQEAPVKAEAKPVAPKPVVKPVVKEVSKPVAPKPEVKKTPAVKAEHVKPAAPVKKAEAVKAPAAPKAVSAPKPAAQSKSGVVSSAEDKPGEYYVQLASFKSLDLAENEYHAMSSKISDLQLVKVDLGDKGVWYRLRCGKPLSYSAAKAKAADISSKTGYNPDIMKK